MIHITLYDFDIQLFEGFSLSISGYYCFTFISLLLAPWVFPVDVQHWYLLPPVTIIS